MGILDDFKRLFWANKAVTKSAVDKALNKDHDLMEDESGKVSDPWDSATIKNPKDAEKENKNKTSDTWTQKDDWAPKEPPVSKSKDSDAYKAGEKLGEVAGKVGEVAGKTWDKAKEEGKELLDKAVKTSDKVWEKAEDVSEDVWSKAKDVANKANEKFQEGVDSMLEKAKALDKKIEEEKDKIDPNRDGWADTSVRDKMKEHDSTLKDKDDFFERADRYAQGDYSMGKPVVTKTSKDEPPPEEGMTPLPPLPKKDDIVDDAILDEDDDAPKK